MFSRVIFGCCIAVVFMFHYCCLLVFLCSGATSAYCFTIWNAVFVFSFSVITSYVNTVIRFCCWNIFIHTIQNGPAFKVTCIYDYAQLALTNYFKILNRLHVFEKYGLIFRSICLLIHTTAVQGIGGSSYTYCFGSCCFQLEILRLFTCTIFIPEVL